MPTPTWQLRACYGPPLDEPPGNGPLWFLAVALLAVIAGLMSGCSAPAPLVEPVSVQWCDDPTGDFFIPCEDVPQSFEL